MTKKKEIMETPKTQEQKEKDLQPKEDRKTRRIRAEKAAILETLINLYITERGSLKDPDGEESAQRFNHYRNMWINECKAFNKKNNRSLTLRSDAFKDQVERILNIEAINKKKKAEENKVRDFSHWMRRTRLWYDYPFKLFWYWILSWGNHEKETEYWKQFYLKNIVRR